MYIKHLMLDFINSFKPNSDEWRDTTMTKSQLIGKIILDLRLSTLLMVILTIFI